MVAWLVLQAIGESDELDHLKSLTNLKDPKWPKRVTVDSPAGTGGFGEEASLANQ
jgi:hypothetical protein